MMSGMLMNILLVIGIAYLVNFIKTSFGPEEANTAVGRNSTSSSQHPSAYDRSNSGAKPYQDVDEFDVEAAKVEEVTDI